LGTCLRRNWFKYKHIQYPRTNIIQWHCKHQPHRQRDRNSHVSGGDDDYFGIDTGYTPGTSITSTATINSQTLASIGFTTTGLLGTWTLEPKDGSDPYTANDTIQVVIGAPPSPSTAVPGPLPLFGAAAAFGWSRRLRKRITAPLITPPQA